MYDITEPMLKDVSYHFYFPYKVFSVKIMFSLVPDFSKQLFVRIKRRLYWLFQDFNNFIVRSNASDIGHSDFPPLVTSLFLYLCGLVK